MIHPLGRNVSRRMTLPTSAASQTLQREACVPSIAPGSLSPAGSILAGPRLKEEGWWRAPHRSGLQRFNLHFTNSTNLGIIK